MIATIHSNDRIGLLAAGLVAAGLAAAGAGPTVVAVAANGSQACASARLAGPFDLLRPEPRDADAVIAELASRPAGDVVAVLPVDLLRGVGADGRGRVRVVATACRLTAAQALHAKASGAWHLRNRDEPDHKAWRDAPRVLPLRLPRLSPLEQMRVLGGDLDHCAKSVAVALAATFLAVSADPQAECLEVGDLTGLMASAVSAGDEDLRERLLDCAAALGDPHAPSASLGIAGTASARGRKSRSALAFARSRVAQPALLRA